MDDDFWFKIPIGQVEFWKIELNRIKGQRGKHNIIRVCIRLFKQSFSVQFMNVLRYKPLSSDEWAVVRNCFARVIPESINIDKLVEKLHQSVGPYSSKHPSSTTKASYENLLSAYGSNRRSSLEDELSTDLIGCSRFLVPFFSDQCFPFKRPKNSMYNLILDPLLSVTEIAGIAKEYKDCVGFIEGLLAPTFFPVPTIEGLEGDKLAKHPVGRRFENKIMNYYLEYLFKIIAALGPDIGIDVKLNRFDLFHGHMFVSKDGRLGILFHAREYPAMDDKFKLPLGICQKGSTVKYDDAMNLRNILWLAPVVGDSRYETLSPGVLVSLDAHPNGIIYRDIVFDDESTKLVRTIFEDGFGAHVGDVNYLNVRNEEYQIFICTPKATNR